MPRPKTDADKLKILRDERRELLRDELPDAVDDDRDSEITVPNLHIHVPPAAVPPPAAAQTPLARPSAPPARAPSGSHAELAHGVLERVKTPWQALVVVVFILAVLAAALAGQKLQWWGGAHGAPGSVVLPAGGK